jgi:Na+/H+ antiporter NhaD/arsenite permease-like protein
LPCWPTYFEKSELPAALPNIMPGFMPTDWRGCFMVLLLVFVLSGFLDNIAAAMIGGALANTVFKGRCTSAFWRPSWRPRTPAGPAAWWATPPPR